MKNKNILEKYWIGGSIGFAIGLFSFPAIILSKFFSVTNQDILAIVIFGAPIWGAVIGMLVEWLVTKKFNGGSFFSSQP